MNSQDLIFVIREVLGYAYVIFDDGDWLNDHAANLAQSGWIGLADMLKQVGQIVALYLGT